MRFPNGGNRIYGHPTSLTLAQPNFHYPIPTSFELTQRGPTDWVCLKPIRACCVVGSAAARGVEQPKKTFAGIQPSLVSCEAVSRQRR